MKCGPKRANLITDLIVRAGFTNKAAFGSFPWNGSVNPALGKVFRKVFQQSFLLFFFDIETKGFVTLQASIGPRQLQNAVLYLASLWFCRTNSSKTCSFGTVERFVVALNPFYYVTLAGMGYSIEYDVAAVKNFSRSRSTCRYCLYWKQLPKTQLYNSATNYL